MMFGPENIQQSFEHLVRRCSNCLNSPFALDDINQLFDFIEKNDISTLNFNFDDNVSYREPPFVLIFKTIPALLKFNEINSVNYPTFPFNLDSEKYQAIFDKVLKYQANKINWNHEDYFGLLTQTALLEGNAAALSYFPQIAVKAEIDFTKWQLLNSDCHEYPINLVIANLDKFTPANAKVLLDTIVEKTNYWPHDRSLGCSSTFMVLLKFLRNASVENQRAQTVKDTMIKAIKVDRVDLMRSDNRNPIIHELAGYARIPDNSPQFIEYLNDFFAIAFTKPNLQLTVKRGGLSVLDLLLKATEIYPKFTAMQQLSKIVGDEYFKELAPLYQKGSTPACLPDSIENIWLGYLSDEKDPLVSQLSLLPHLKKKIYSDAVPASYEVAASKSNVLKRGATAVGGLLLSEFKHFQISRSPVTSSSARSTASSSMSASAYAASSSARFETWSV